MLPWVVSFGEKLRTSIWLGRNAIDGLARVQDEFGIPIGLGVVTPDNMEQAMARAGGSVGHAGVQAAEAALEMANFSAMTHT